MLPFPEGGPLRQSAEPLTAMPELWIFAVLLILYNIHLFTGSAPAGFGVLSGALSFGGLVRILVHPFVHVSWYHLLLDSGAFFLLYTCLRQKRALARLGCFGACAAGSLGLSLALSPIVRANGLCGLSGVTHGLMGVAALEMIAKNERLPGAGCLALVIAKSVFEVLSGDVLFSSLHVGDIGSAVPAAHLGGVLGGIAAFAAVAVFRKYANPIPVHERVLACDIRGET